MSTTAILLGLLAAFLGLGALRRLGKARTRPIFRQSDIFAGRLTEGLLHALISDRGYVRADTRVAGVLGSAVIVERAGACGRLVLSPALGFGRENDLPGLAALAERHLGDRTTTIVVIGGGEEFGKSAFEATAPVRTLSLIHI